MSGTIRILTHAFLMRVMGIAALSLAYSTDGLTKNICATNALQVNPQTANHSNVKNQKNAVIIQSVIDRADIQNGGIGGTGNKEGGIGGTGGQATNNGGMSGTGIIGIITGFASICVNGIKIHYHPDTPVTIDGQSSTTQNLAVGQMVAVRADGTGNEVTARNIAVMHAVIGPVDSISPETGKMQVLDQTIQVRDHDLLENLQTNEWVQISGHRLSDGTIVASRVEFSQPLEQFWINGHVTQADTAGFEVNGTRIEIDQHVRPEGIIPGVEISASGQWNNESLQVQHVQVDPTDQLMDEIERVVIEGYVQPINSGEFSLGGQTFVLEPDLQATVDPIDDIGQDQLIQASGQLAPDQSIILDHVEFSPFSATFISDVEIDNILEIDEGNVNDIDDAPQHEIMEQPDHSNSLDGSIPSPLESIEFFEALGNFDSIDIVDDHLGIPVDLNAIDEPIELDIPQDIDDNMHYDNDSDLDWDWEYDRH